MRLRQITLALIALLATCAVVAVQRNHPHDAQAPVVLSAAPLRADVSPAAKSPKLRHVPGLARPVAATPIVVKDRPQPRVHRPVVAAKPRVARRVRVHAAPKRAVKPRQGGQITQVEVGNRSYADTPPPPLDPLQISGVQVSALTSSSAQITWQTNVPTLQQTAFGLDAPTVWTPPSSTVVIDHTSTITGLEFSTTYTAYLHAVDEWNRAQTATVTFTTGPMLDQSNARTSGNSIFVDDRPFFPTAVWQQCSDMFGSNMANGINLFMGDGCKDDSELPDRLGGQAYSVVDSEHANATGRGVIGWYFPDEWDAYLKSNVTRNDLAGDIPSSRPGRISFLTLTNHFYSHAAPLPQGKGMYPVLFTIPDVIGFDLYPLQVWCKPAFADVYDAQSELRSDTGGKPTFQWIEVAPMEQPCHKNLALDPTPDTVRAEAWLSIAGGASGIGYFPNHWSDPIGAQITQTNREIKALTQALLAPIAGSSSDNPLVRVSARTLNGALYVIAVNTTDAQVQARINVDGIAGRSALVLDGGSPPVGADNTGFSDTFPPLAARVYVIPPAGWS